MARFELNKGERFTLKKSEGLTSLKVELGWTVPKRFIGSEDAPDPDACSFLLGEDGVIMNDADFVFYNSNNREEPFSREKFGNKKKWRDETFPMSLDGAVKGPHDDRGNAEDSDESEESGEGNEEITVDLTKVNPKVTEIAFCATMYNHEKYSFGDVEGLHISIINDEDGQELCRYNLKENFKAETAVVAGSLICDEEGEWSFEATGKGYTGGMQTLIDIYA